MMNAIKCELYETTDAGQELAATSTLEDGKVTGKAEPGSEELVNGMEHHHFFANGRQIAFKDDPVAWFMALPEFYDGSLLRAHIVPGAQKKKEAFAASRASNSLKNGTRPSCGCKNPITNRPQTKQDGHYFFDPWRELANEICN